MRAPEFLNRLTGKYQRTLSGHLFQRRLEMLNTRPIISFTFDDFPRSALANGGAILQNHGLLGTYYVSLGLMDKVEPTGKMFALEHLNRAFIEGHELGCHTFSHCHSWNTRPADFEASIVANEQALRRLVPQARFKTFSFPISSPSPEAKRRAATHFECCRGGDQVLNMRSADLNNIKAFFLERSRDDIGTVQQIIDRNARERGWLVFATHDVDENPTRYGCTPAFFADVVGRAVRSGATILPMFHALQSIKGIDQEQHRPDELGA